MMENRLLFFKLPFIVFLVLATTSKMTSAFAILLILPLFWGLMSKQIKLKISVKNIVINFIACSFILNKQIQNLFVYKKIFQLDSYSKEHSGFQLNNLLAGLPDLIFWLLGIQGDLALNGFQDDAHKGMGLVCSIILLSIGVVLLTKWLYIKKTILFKDMNVVFTVGVLALLGVFLVMAYIENQDEHMKSWCRFVAPYVFIACCTLIFILNRLISNDKYILYTVLVLVICATSYHYICAFKSSMSLSHKGIRDMIDKIVNYDRYQSRFGLAFGPGTTSENLYRQAADSPINILVYTLMYNCPYSWVFGDNFAWSTTVTDQKKTLLNNIKNDQYDYLAIVYYSEQELHPGLQDTINSLPDGYEIIEKTRFVTLFKNKFNKHISDRK